MPTIVSLTLSPIVTRTIAGKAVTSGIFKQPVREARLTTLGLVGDDVADKKHHGGPHQALYVYPVHHYDAFRSELKRDDLPLGWFGENAAVTELDETMVCVGDVFTIGDGADGPVVQATSPRMPCNTLAGAMGDPKFVKTFLDSGRLGWYCRVIREGTIRVGDAYRLTTRDPARFDIRRLARVYSRGKEDRDGLAAALKVEALHPTWREKFAQRLNDER